ncbi:hypothetical protein COJ77_05875 [Bacillus cereus]|uniref:Uncharacterized protein n=1 Tax=Bacillus cereus TaxID=1396 RepID=A0AA44QC77_BACCE|nr:hypothetical protein COJ55_05615 [Bacillus cereus]PFO84335.1 hypothetical protein COJ77_05875 [Bacillus cereus]PFS02244.1 hypothetical protein COK38_09620 [Bacillus cereus]
MEQGWNHENTFVPFLGMSVFFFIKFIAELKGGAVGVKQLIRTRTTIDCANRKKLIIKYFKK